MESNGNRLLVVDDQPDILDFVGQVAESVGYEVRLANDAEAVPRRRPLVPARR